MVNTAAVYAGLTGAAHLATKTLATGTLNYSAPMLLLTAWGADSIYYEGPAVTQGFTILGTLTNYNAEEIASHAYFFSP
jgi:hypothetical protein